MVPGIGKQVFDYVKSNVAYNTVNPLPFLEGYVLGVYHVLADLWALPIVHVDTQMVSTPLRKNPNPTFTLP